TFPFVFLGVTDVFTGTGEDTVNVQRTDVHSVLDIHGVSGRDTVNLGNAGSMQGIAGVVNIDNQGSFTSIVADDSADLSGRNVLLSSTSIFSTITGLSPGDIHYTNNDTQLVFLQGGPGGNTFTVDDTFKAASGSSISTTILNTGTGADTVNVR